MKIIFLNHISMLISNIRRIAKPTEDQQPGLAYGGCLLQDLWLVRTGLKLCMQTLLPALDRLVSTRP